MSTVWVKTILKYLSSFSIASLESNTPPNAIFFYYTRLPNCAFYFGDQESSSHRTPSPLHHPKRSIYHNAFCLSEIGPVRPYMSRVFETLHQLRREIGK